MCGFGFAGDSEHHEKNAFDGPKAANRYPRERKEVELAGGGCGWLLDINSAVVTRAGVINGGRGKTCKDGPTAAAWTPQLFKPTTVYTVREGGRDR